MYPFSLYENENMKKDKINGIRAASYKITPYSSL